MSRKVFLSFLGTNNYVNSNYCYGKKCVNDIKFVQEAMIKLFCSGFTNKDRVFIFVTQKAREINWKEGLETRLKTFRNGMQIQAIDIPDGKSEAEIWEIFNVVFAQLEDEDEIIFDITHGFRSLPMLGLVLLNYARLLKKVKIKAIYYGAFEALGTARSVKEMEQKDRNAPIFDLTNFVRLQDWILATDDFIENGQTKRLKSLVDLEIKPILKESKEKGEELNKLKKLFELIDNYTKNILTNRGPLINKTDGYEINDLLSNISRELIPPLEPISKQIKEQLKNLKKDDTANGFAAVEWCIRYNLIPQAYTILQENIVTTVLQEMQKNVLCLSWRESVNSAFIIKSKNLGEDVWKGDKDKIREILDYAKTDSLIGVFSELTNTRNDINHAGWRENKMSAERLKQKLEDIYKRVKEVLKDEDK